jgi:hypothetical protein
VFALLLNANLNPSQIEKFLKPGFSLAGISAVEVIVTLRIQHVGENLGVVNVVWENGKTMDETMRGIDVNTIIVY